MAKSRRANAVVFGFDFQVNAAIVLMIENIEDLKSLRLEGNYEDIEIELENNQYILAQAKAVERSSSDFRNVRKNLEKSLISLSEGNQKVDAQRLILITNSPNPLNEEASRSIFWGDAHREFLSLPESSQELIRRYLDNINQPLDTDKFMIQILPFETDNDIERYKVVKRVVDDFIGDLNLNIPGLGKKLLSIWHEEVFENGTKKDAAIQLKKKDLICGIAISYLVRVNISHAIIPIAEEYSLNEVQQGMLLSAFAWGYVALMFIGGILVDKFGALKMSFRSAIAWSVCTAVSSVAEVDIERVKVDIKSREVDIESTKVDIRNKLLSFSDTISEKTINHTVEIFSKCGKENCFGRTIVEEITGLKPSRASKLIKLLVDSEVIVPVTGHGKGKYRFQ